MDIVTVVHNETNLKLSEELIKSLNSFEEDLNIIVYSNIEKNLGFSKGCNLGAAKGSSEIIGFLNPDVIIRGPFVNKVKEVFKDPNVVITGSRFNKPERELRIWGVRDWVCGAVFFVRRSFFDLVGGFDERFVWSWEETDMIRQAESMGYIVRSIDLPIDHSSPSENSEEDAIYKRRFFSLGMKRYYHKWGNNAI